MKITSAGYRVERAMKNLFLTETVDQFFEKQPMLRSLKGLKPKV